jgi:hypothetical protein
MTSWIDYTRRNDPACEAGVDRLRSKLQGNFPDVFCFWSKAPGKIFTLYSDLIKKMQDNGTVVLAQFTINNYGEPLEQVKVNTEDLM